MGSHSGTEYSSEGALRLSGDLDFRVVESTRLALQQALAQAQDGLVVDLSAVDFIDSSGVSVLTEAARHAERRRLAFAAFVLFAALVFAAFAVTGTASSAAAAGAAAAPAVRTAAGAPATSRVVRPLTGSRRASTRMVCENVEIVRLRRLSSWCSSALGTR